MNLESVKAALGITGDFQDSTIQIYYDEVMSFLSDSGIPAAKITPGLVARGVTDLWNYGEAGGKLSEYFYQRAAQLAIKQ